MKRFEELEAEVMADPARRERVERERAKVVAEQVRDALGELRRVRQLTQVELSRTMQRPQSTISRIEREGDMLLSTLAAYVEALGGHLEINAIVDGRRIALTATDTTTTRRTA
jgi:ribosome-binding protein aMBF1 (putative translation factor)